MGGEEQAVPTLAEAPMLSVERIERSHLLRYHPRQSVDYSFAIVVVPAPDDMDVALLKGATGQIPYGGMGMLREQLAMLGYKRAAWVRADGRQREMQL